MVSANLSPSRSPAGGLNQDKRESPPIVLQNIKLYFNLLGLFALEEGRQF